MSIVDGTNLPEHIRSILAKRPEERTPFEQAAIDAYDRKYKDHGGALKVAEIVDVEEVAPERVDRKVCRLTGRPEKCDDGSRGSKCLACNPSGKL